MFKLVFSNELNEYSLENIRDHVRVHMSKLTTKEFEYELNSSEVINGKHHISLHLYNFNRTFVGNYLGVEIPSSNLIFGKTDGKRIIPKI